MKLKMEEYDGIKEVEIDDKDLPYLIEIVDRVLNEYPDVSYDPERTTLLAKLKVKSIIQSGEAEVLCHCLDVMDHFQDEYKSASLAKIIRKGFWSNAKKRRR